MTKGRRVVITWLLFVVLLALLVGCQSTDNGATMMATERAMTANKPDGQGEQAGQMIFRVGSKTVTIGDYKQRLKEEIGPLLEQFLAQGRTRQEITDVAEQQNVRQLVLDRMIQEELLLWLADQDGVEVDPGAVAAEVERRQQQQGSLDQATPTSETDVVELRAEVARQQRILTMIARHTKADSFHSRHILLEVQVPVTATQKQRDAAFARVKPEAEALMDDLRQGSDFAELAKEHSDDPGSASRGGDLGWVTRGLFVPEFETIALSPTVELNAPVLTTSQYGYHIIEVLGRKLDEPFESVEDLRNASNPGAIIDASFIPWYEEFREEAEEEGTLEVNPVFDPTLIPLPFPEP